MKIGTVKSLNSAAFLLSLVICGLCAADIRYDIERDFKNPPDSARPQTWWHWINGNVTKEGITADLEAMDRAGIGGFQAFHVRLDGPAGTVGYMSNQWRDMMEHAIKESDRLGLEVCLHNCAGWSSSGGPWILPKYSMKKVVWTETKTQGPTEFNAVLEQPETNLQFYQDIAVIAFPTPSGEMQGEGFRLNEWRAKAAFEQKHDLKHDDRQIGVDDIIAKDKIIVLRGKLQDNKLQWKVPAGNWTIVRLGYTSTGVTNKPAPAEGLGLECDKLSRAAVQFHWNNSMQRVIDDAGPLAGKALSSVLIDSYEVGSQNWTEELPNEFRRRMGYDLVGYLPALTGRCVESIEVTERFLWDFRRVIADVFTDNYFGYFAEMCHRNGMKLAVEPYSAYGGNFDDYMAASKADIPMGEWWATAKERWHHASSKMASSIAHTYGRKYVGAEAFTGAASTAFDVHPYLIKSQGDYFYCQGVNRFIFHTYVHQPWMGIYPGMTMGPYGIQMNRNNTWFEKSSAWLKYLARCQYLLQEGRVVADICYFSGEEAPSRTPWRENIVPAVPSGYDYDFCTVENLLSMTVEDGVLTLPGGMQYRMLVLPELPMRPETLRKVRQLVNDGAAVYGSRPGKSPSLSGYPACDGQMEEIAEELWGKGKVISGRPLAEVLKSRQILPDFEFTTDKIDIPTQYTGSGVEFIHRRIEDADVYFVSNQHQLPKMVEAVFRVGGKQPELWNAEMGEIEDTPQYSFTKDGRTAVSLELDGAGSVFVVFRKPANALRVETIEFKHVDAKEDTGADLVIQRAVYGYLAGSADEMVDVTDKIKGMVTSGRLAVTASNEIAGDPAHKMDKQLQVDYLFDGKPFVKTVKENEMLVLPLPEQVQTAGYKVCYDDGQIALSALKAGSYELVLKDSKKQVVQINDIPKEMVMDGPWQLCFPSGWGAPDKVELSELIDWTEHENFDVKHFSGTAVYSKSFNMPAERIQGDQSIFLDLGTINVIADVKLNGQSLGILWKPPFRVDVTDVIRAGENTLEIEVTNLWTNRLIGDETYADDCKLGYNEKHRGRYVEKLPVWMLEGKKRPDTGRKTFVTWRHYTAQSALAPSGMTGPVRLVFAKKVRL